MRGFARTRTLRWRTRGAVCIGKRRRGGVLVAIKPNRRHVYESLTGKGMSKKKAAKIANAGTTHAKRSRMAKKAARTRKKRRK